MFVIIVAELNLMGSVLPANLVISWILKNLPGQYKTLVQTIVQSIRRSEHFYTLEVLYETLVLFEITLQPLIAKSRKYHKSFGTR